MIFGRCKALRRPYSQAAVRFLHVKRRLGRDPYDPLRCPRARQPPNRPLGRPPARASTRRRVRLARPPARACVAPEASAYASAPAPAASARRRSRPRSASASRAREAGARAHDRPRAASSAPSLALGMGAPAATRRASSPRASRGRRADAGRAVGDDARCETTFDELIVELRPTSTRARSCSPTASTASSPRPPRARRRSRRSPSSSSSTASGRSTSSWSTRPPRTTRSTSSQAPARLTGFLEGRAMDIFMVAGSPLHRRPCSRAARASRPAAGWGNRPSSSASSRAPPASSSPGRSRGLLPAALGPPRGLRERAPASTRCCTTRPRASCRHLSRARARAEAAFLHRSLLDAGLPYGALVVNRVHEGRIRRTRARGAPRALDGGRSPPGAGVMRSVERFRGTRGRDREIACEPLAGLARALPRERAGTRRRGRRPRGARRVSVACFADALR